jgi:hypothetical protein
MYPKICALFSAWIQYRMTSLQMRLRFADTLKELEAERGKAEERGRRLQQARHDHDQDRRRCQDLESLVREASCLFEQPTVPWNEVRAWQDDLAQYQLAARRPHDAD